MGMELKNKAKSAGNVVYSFFNDVSDRAAVSIASVFLKSGVSENKILNVLKKIGVPDEKAMGIMASVAIETEYGKLKTNPEEPIQKRTEMDVDTREITEIT